MLRIGEIENSIHRGMGQDVHVYSNADVEDICGNFSPSNLWCVAAFSALYSGGILPPSTECVSRGCPTLRGPDSWRHHDADYLETTAGRTLLRPPWTASQLPTTCQRKFR